MNPTVVWLLVGITLCLMELLLPTAFVEFAMGISALLVALVALVLPQFSVQVVLWLGLSIVLIIFTRRLLPRARVSIMQDAAEARTLTEIAPGEVGRVLYEGNSWQARCEGDVTAVASNRKVYVIGREGNTLIVIPAQFPPHLTLE